MTKVSTTPLSEAEEAAYAAESRRATAEGEFVVLCEDKKRVEKEMDLMNEEIKKLEKQVEDRKTDIQTTEQYLRESEESFQNATSELGKILEEYKKADKVLEVLNKKASDDSRAAKENIASLDSVYANKKKGLEDEIEVLVNHKGIFENEIKELQSKVELEQDNEEKAMLANEKLEMDGVTILAERKAAESEMKEMEDKILMKKSLIDSKNKQLEELAATEKDTSESIKTYEGLKEKLQKEVTDLESRAFSISSREDELKRKEGFIKNKYERAGIKFEE